MSIKRKLTLMMMGISVVTVMLTVGAITAFLIYDLHRSRAQELGITASIAADRNSAALLFLDNERAQKNLDIYRQNAAILAVCLYDANGGLFAFYNPEGKENTVTCPQNANALPASLPGMLIARQSVIQSGESAGQVFIASDTREIDAYVNKILQISATATALMLVGAFFATLYFQRGISGPILALADTAQSVTDKRDYTIEANGNYSGEAGTLARAFNRMLAEVRTRDAELTRANETLEQKVTERTRALESAMHRAEAASEAKSEFLRNMSHEFRTPLHALLSFTAYGIKESETATRGQLREYFELMQKGTHRLSKLVGEVLDLAKLERGEQVFSLQRTDLAELARKATEQLAPLLKEKQLQLRVESCDETGIVCDADKIMQVLTNLLGNAIKFTPAGRSITLRLDHNAANFVRLSVIDQGIGIPETECESIFESFHQSTRTNSGAGGTGLGLAICRHIITAHGGRIWAENNENGGACVTFTLPVALEEGIRRLSMAA